jgi:hypothetical protein
MNCLVLRKKRLKLIAFRKEAKSILAVLLEGLFALGLEALAVIKANSGQK